MEILLDQWFWTLAAVAFTGFCVVLLWIAVFGMAVGAVMTLAYLGQLIAEAMEAPVK